MSKKPTGPHQAPTVADVARMKSGYAKTLGGSTPPPQHVRRIESAASKAAAKGGNDMTGPRTGGSEPPRKHDEDNRADQLNPNNDAYWQSRGEDGRPDDWEDRIQSGQDD